MHRVVITYQRSSVFSCCHITHINPHKNTIKYKNVYKKQSYANHRFVTTMGKYVTTLSAHNQSSWARVRQPHLQPSRTSEDETGAVVEERISKHFDVMHEYLKMKRISRKRFVFSIVKVKRLWRSSTTRIFFSKEWNYGENIKLIESRRGRHVGGPPRGHFAGLNETSWMKRYVCTQ